MKMKIELEVPDHKVAFVMELLTSIPFIKAKLSSKKAKQDTTEYLLSSEANKERLLAAIERSKNGEVVAHNLLEE